jgi:formamidase
MPDVVFSVDQSRSMRDQAVPGHNRWHPDIPPAVTVRPGQDIRVECKEWTDGQILNNDSANDVRDVDLSHAHMLSGPIAVEGAEPGDLLVVDILDLGPVPQVQGPNCGEGWGYSGIFAKVNGGGFLTDYFPDAYKAIWDFRGQTCSSRHVPGVQYTGITHPGLFGTAPSPDLLARWNARERALIATDPDRVPPLGLPPLPDGVLGGTATGALLEAIGRDGARTVPARENGGNHDIKNFTRGSRVFYPVYVDGALLSGGDLHFSQGTARSTSAAPSRWAASSTSTSTSSRAAWRPTASPPTRSSCPAGWSRATRSSSPSSGSRSTTATTRTPTWTRRWPTATPA